MREKTIPLEDDRMTTQRWPSVLRMPRTKIILMKANRMLTDAYFNLQAT